MPIASFHRPIYGQILKRILEKRRFIQVLSGPRQVGKTTLVQQIQSKLNFPTHYASADEPTLRDRTWLEQQWEIGRLNLKHNGHALLILDEIQKIKDWSETVKFLWDKDSSTQRALKVILLGSTPLLVHEGLTESLAGRFEILFVPHWSFREMSTAFGWTLEQYIFYGGYPGAAPLIDDPMRWSRYIIDSLIETTISRDVLLMNRVDKPILLRRLFELGTRYSGQIVSYQKMLGQLQDAGNTTTLAHYLQLLNGAGLLAGLEKFSGSKVRQRASSPKLQPFNLALVNAPSDHTLETAQANRDIWGRLVEATVGAHLMNQTLGTALNVTYWREGNHEVDFVLASGQKILAIEVKSGRHRPSNLAGTHAFLKRYPSAKPLLVGADGIPLENFLSHSPTYYL